MTKNQIFDRFSHSLIASCLFGPLDERVGGASVYKEEPCILYHLLDIGMEFLR